MPTCRALSMLWCQAMLEPQDSTSLWSYLLNVVCSLIWVPISPSSLLFWLVFAIRQVYFLSSDLWLLLLRQVEMPLIPFMLSLSLQGDGSWNPKPFLTSDQYVWFSWFIHFTQLSYYSQGLPSSAVPWFPRWEDYEFLNSHWGGVEEFGAGKNRGQLDSSGKALLAIIKTA